MATPYHALPTRSAPSAGVLIPATSNAPCATWHCTGRAPRVSSNRPANLCATNVPSKPRGRGREKRKRRRGREKKRSKRRTTSRHHPAQARWGPQMPRETYPPGGPIPRGAPRDSQDRPRPQRLEGPVRRGDIHPSTGGDNHLRLHRSQHRGNHREQGREGPPQETPVNRQ